MEKFKGTPGPWTYNGEGGTDYAVFTDAYGYEVLGVSEWIRINPEDAKAIAAVPDLIYGLQRMEDFVRRSLTLEGKLTEAEIDFICKPATDALQKAL